VTAARTPRADSAAGAGKTASGNATASGETADAGTPGAAGAAAETRHTLRLTGSGPTREKAFAAAMRQVQQAVGERTDGVCFRVEPVRLTVLSAVEHRWTERFLGLLFPRKRSRFELTLRIDVRAFALDVDGLHFSVREEQLTPLQHVLQMR